MDRLQSIETFVRVAQAQSFAAAARQLRVSNSVVTTRIKQLEDFLGAPLFHRSTRVVRLTDIGQAFLRDCTELVGHANEIVDQMRDVRAKPSGVLRVHALTGMVLGHFAALLRRFQTTYPDIRLELIVSDAVVDPVKAGVDCALQIFPAASQELVSRQLFFVRRVFCATPAYLKAHGAPENPRDLHRHTLGLYSDYPTRDRWTFHHRGQQVTIYLNATLLTNSVHLLREYALEHAGIVCLPTIVAGEAILRGDLQVVLPEQQLSSFPLCAVYPDTSRKDFKLRLFIEHIGNEFTHEPPWDAALIAKGDLPARMIEG
ncbi:LysR substrate-binding domain-containing protein [Variovorax sp. OV329]|uniref:LysR substrate-binding domain-containing protein n=1 Tax=Variovorax sp. OV329 TaxID=1882825 RepID=UPI0008E447D9|nr:LysR substrate-binding domain-containing protein [Variovorax sp. OV329]SFM74724.1 transcriptional regulator, LysR family [Variovorax sp. OV329]